MQNIENGPVKATQFVMSDHKKSSVVSHSNTKEKNVKELSRAQMTQAKMNGDLNGIFCHKHQNTDNEGPLGAKQDQIGRTHNALNQHLKCSQITSQALLFSGQKQLQMNTKMLKPEPNLVLKLI